MSEKDARMKRILVIGTSGAGKSTLAQRVSKSLGLPFVASDHFYWEPGWKVASAEKVHLQLREVVGREEWVLDGNFDDEREFVWCRADCIIWLDYSLLTICSHIVLRNFLWVITQEPTWSGNRMTLQRAVSGLRHAVKSYRIKRRNYPQWLAELSGVPSHRFCTSREAEDWLQSLNQQMT
jgi:adenylate kinase family enzyme